MKGSVPAFVALADRVDGKPSQAVTGEGGGPMRVHVTIERIGGDGDIEELQVDPKAAYYRASSA